MSFAMKLVTIFRRFARDVVPVRVDVLGGELRKARTVICEGARDAMRRGKAEDKRSLAVESRQIAGQD